jgi:hypothetical protein
MKSKNRKKRNRRIALIFLTILTISLYLITGENKKEEVNPKIKAQNLVKTKNCYPNVIKSLADTSYMDNADTQESTFIGKKAIIKNGCQAIPMRSHGNEKDTVKSTTNGSHFQIKRSGKINYNKLHKISQDIMYADTIFIKVLNSIDLTGEVSKYPLFNEQKSYINKLVTKAYLGYNKRLIEAKMMLYAEDDYTDDLPEPHLIVELYVKQFELTKGKQRKWQETFFVDTVDKTRLTTDWVWWEKYITVKFTSQIRIMDNQCRLIISRPEETEYTHSFSWSDIYGDEYIIPKAYRNSLKKLVPVLREDEWVVMTALKKHIKETTARAGSHLNPYARKRVNINL